MTAAIALRRLSLGHRSPAGCRLLLREVDVEVAAGSLVVLAGPSGSGKTTLLQRLLGLADPLDPTQVLTGELRVLDRDVRSGYPRGLRARAAAVLQSEGLLDDRSPCANVELGIAAGNRRHRAQELLQRVGLPAPPEQVAELSGGQRKRVALARALGGDPDLLFLDEPTAGLDAASSAQIVELIRATHAQGSARGPRTTVVVTHDHRFLSVCDRVLWLDPPGRQLLVLTPAQAAPRFAEDAVTAPAAPHSLVPASRVGFALRRGLSAVSRVGNLLLSVPAALPPVHPLRALRDVLDSTLGTAWFVVLGTALIGGLSTYFALRNNPLQGAFQAEILAGVGKVQAAVLIPLLAAFFFAARFAAGAAARVGSMRRTAQFEALRLLGYSPQQFLLTPLLWGGVCGLVVLSFAGVVAALLASLGSAFLQAGLPPRAAALAILQQVTAADLRFVLGKAVGSGLLVAVVTWLLASSPKPSADSVGQAVNGAIVLGVLVVLLFHAGVCLTQFA